MKNKIPLLSFYSGGGFLDMGFEMAGFHTVWANEYDKGIAYLNLEGTSSWRKFNNNKTDPGILNTDSITEISSIKILSEAFNNNKPKDFGIIGGPPCQDFTMNGKLRGFNGERGKLTVVFFDKIIDLMPTFFVMENVPGLISRKETKEFLYSIFKEVGVHYFIDHRKINSLDFGVPQSRDRVFFIGIKKSSVHKNLLGEFSLGNWFPFPINKKYQNAGTIYKWPSAVPFGKKLEKPKDLPIELCVENCLVKNGSISAIPNANEYPNLYVSKEVLETINEGETNRQSFKRLHRFKYSPTACYGNNEIHLHPYEQRRLSVRETLRIQGVPDSYILPKEFPLTKKYKMIGNGVPVPMAKAIATALKQFLIEKKIYE